MIHIEKTILVWEDAFGHQGYMCKECPTTIPQGDVTQICETVYNEENCLTIKRSEYCFLCDECKLKPITEGFIS